MHPPPSRGKWNGFVEYLASPSSLYTHMVTTCSDSGGSTLHCIVPWLVCSDQYTYLESFYIDTKYTKVLVSTRWRVCTHVPLNALYSHWLVCSNSLLIYTKVYLTPSE